jgi:hypothetical protein
VHSLYHRTYDGSPFDSNLVANSLKKNLVANQAMHTTHHCFTLSCDTITFKTLWKDFVFLFFGEAVLSCACMVEYVVVGFFSGCTFGQSLELLLIFLGRAGTL